MIGENASIRFGIATWSGYGGSSRVVREVPSDATSGKIPTERNLAKRYGAADHRSRPFWHVLPYRTNADSRACVRQAAIEILMQPNFRERIDVGSSSRRENPPLLAKCRHVSYRCGLRT